MSCQNCGSSTTYTCSHCEGTRYCNGSCQDQDKTVHKQICDRELGLALERVAQILQGAYLAFRENTFDTPIREVISALDKLTVYDGDQAQNTTYFTAFPNHLVQNSASDKMALLTAWTCNEPYAFLHSLIVKLLRGSYFRLCCFIPLISPRPQCRHRRTKCRLA